MDSSNQGQAWDSPEYSSQFWIKLDFGDERARKDQVQDVLSKFFCKHLIAGSMTVSTKPFKLKEDERNAKKSE